MSYGFPILYTASGDLASTYGTVELDAVGQKTINSNIVQNGDCIILTHLTSGGGTPGNLRVDDISDGNFFNVISSSNNDQNRIAWIILKSTENLVANLAGKNIALPYCNINSASYKTFGKVNLGVDGQGYTTVNTTACHPSGPSETGSVVLLSRSFRNSSNSGVVIAIRQEGLLTVESRNTSDIDTICWWIINPASTPSGLINQTPICPVPLSHNFTWGIGTMTGGASTVNTTFVKSAHTFYFLTWCPTSFGSPPSGGLYVSAETDSVSFEVASTAGSVDGNFSWLAVRDNFP